MLLTQRPADKTRLELERERILAPEVKSHRMQPAALPASYTIAPRSTFNASEDTKDARPIGAETMAAFRRMTQKGRGGRR
jgi:transcription factor SPN1